ncbi:MAG: hypothetical protein KIT89_11080 [Microcella sp.]|uniref:hypothetical protein n=1 Tax=Microcella sp. TaxID=1913979 RepID=UPI0024C60A08|nr:hypothetical protein [Microcella sp.]UYN83231.1 MAG: hypothetical protein KIT89_11080 [Microcella sp.]
MRWPTITLFPQPYDARATIQVTQWLFIGTLLLPIAVIVAIDAQALLTTGAAIGAVLLIVATTIVMRPPLDLTPTVALFYAVPVLDALALFAMRAQAPTSTTRLLLALTIPAV